MSLYDNLQLFLAIGILLVLWILLYKYGFVPKTNFDKEWLEYLENEEPGKIKYSSYDDFLKAKLREQEENTPKFILVVTKIANIALIAFWVYYIFKLIKVIFFWG